MKEGKIRVRFAPSPTGPLHIGGVRTALYNYLLAKKSGGAFILRIEDTDQNRYVPGAEDYIIEALTWLGLIPDEGVGFGGESGPYRQSERSAIYRKYADILLEKGHAYYAFDSDEELASIRSAYESKKESFKYDFSSRMSMKNSLSLPEHEWRAMLDNGSDYVVRLKVPEDEDVVFQDIVRGDVRFSSNQLDDKVLMKGDGLPTYHLANIVDDHLMEISHVIRGEEWLPSTPTHVLLYRFMGWEKEMPAFCHLPLILKPTGKGKLSKRDGAKFGFPVFPLEWKDPETGEIWEGFRESGFSPESVVNFLALLGWSPPDEQELFSLSELSQVFSPERINKSGARFDFDKAKWFNQQYIIHSEDAALAKSLEPELKKLGYAPGLVYLEKFCSLLKERVQSMNDFLETGYYFFEDVKAYDEKNVVKRWSADRRKQFLHLAENINSSADYSATQLDQIVKDFIEKENLKFGDIFPLLRIALSGSTSGPSLFEMMELMGREMVNQRLIKAAEDFDKIANIA